MSLIADLAAEYCDEILASGQLFTAFVNTIASLCVDREKFPSVKLHLIVLGYVIIISGMSLAMILLYRTKQSRLIVQFFYIYFGMYVAAIIGLITSILLMIEESLIRPGSLAFSSVLTVFLTICLILHLVKYYAFKKQQVFIF